MIAQFSFQRFESVDVVRADGRVVQQRPDLRQLAFHGIKFLRVRAGGTDLLDFAGLIDGTFRLLSQRVQNQVPIVKAFTAWRTIRRIAQVASVALITFVAAHPRQAFALAADAIALIRFRSNSVAFASMALLIRIAPEVRLAFVTLASAETGTASALSIVRITLVVFGAD